MVLFNNNPNPNPNPFSNPVMVQNIIRNYEKLVNNFNEIDASFNPMMTLSGRTDIELRNFNQTLININRALTSVHRFLNNNMMDQQSPYSFFGSGGGYNDELDNNNNNMFGRFFDDFNRNRRWSLGF